MGDGAHVAGRHARGRGLGRGRRRDGGRGVAERGRGAGRGPRAAVSAATAEPALEAAERLLAELHALAGGLVLGPSQAVRAADGGRRHVLRSGAGRSWACSGRTARAREPDKDRALASCGPTPERCCARQAGAGAGLAGLTPATCRSFPVPALRYGGGGARPSRPARGGRSVGRGTARVPRRRGPRRPHARSHRWPLQGHAAAPRTGGRAGRPPGARRPRRADERPRPSRPRRRPRPAALPEGSRGRSPAQLAPDRRGGAGLDRVVILDRGRLAASGTLAELLGRRELRLRLEGVTAEAEERLAAAGPVTRSGTVHGSAGRRRADRDGARPRGRPRRPRRFASTRSSRCGSASRSGCSTSSAPVRAVSRDARWTVLVLAGLTLREAARRRVLRALGGTDDRTAGAQRVGILQARRDRVRGQRLRAARSGSSPRRCSTW